MQVENKEGRKDSVDGRAVVNEERASKDPVQKAREDPTRHNASEVEPYVEDAEEPREAPISHSVIRAPEQNPPLNIPTGTPSTQPLDEAELAHVAKKNEHDINPDRAAHAKAQSKSR